MDSKEVEKVLQELQGVRPEKLTGEAKRVFQAIMKIADERDEALSELKKSISIKTYNQTKKSLKGIISQKEADLYEANNRITDLLDILGDRDRMIDLMITWISENENPFENCYEYSISCADIDCKDCIRKYFEERCKNAKD